MSEHHDMQRIETYPTGAEEWLCPTCGRHFVMHWQPFKRILLHAGDDHVFHAGSKGGVRMTPPTVDVEEDAVLSDDLRQALEDFFNDFDWDD